MKLKDLKLTDILEPKLQHQLILDYISVRPSLIKEAIDKQIESFIGRMVRNMTNTTNSSHPANSKIVMAHSKLTGYVERRFPIAVENIVKQESFQKSVDDAIVRSIEYEMEWKRFGLEPYLKEIIQAEVAAKYTEEIKKALSAVDVSALIKTAVEQMTHQLTR
jgi:hypothetical protein